MWEKILSSDKHRKKRRGKGGKGESSSSSGGGFWISQRRKTLRFPPNQTQINSYFFTCELPCSQLSLQDFTENDLFSFLLLLPKLHLLMPLGAPVLSSSCSSELEKREEAFSHICHPPLVPLFIKGCLIAAKDFLR